ncbi:SDR family oxidoreductase [Bacillus sp. WMMC1349]|uniref:SDR family oxidoreductase n=1 Tax=Bacillus sp. WMMC1349 TaxID=2736254 RepID=UPI0015546402|nr:SDR family oxidoreductase [Bacillus sp. WMMC1349]NPC92292.1 SDR family oxidoreductase [Bacillus sp. WMMC1349]
MILLTGSTGTVGREIVKQLSDLDVPFKTTSRSKKGNGVYFDFEDNDSYLPALNGIEKLFLIRPPHISNIKMYLDPVIDSAKLAGVTQIVFLSLLGVEKNPLVPHYKAERSIKKSGIPYTFLRPSFFMQNLVQQHGEELRKDRQIFVPAGNGRTSFIDVRDIASVAVKTLTEPGHKNQAYSLTGSEVLTYYEVADMLTAELDITFTYANPSAKTFRKRMLEKGVPKEFITIMIGIYLTAKLGLAKKITSDLENILQRQPITVKQFIHDYRDEFI